MSHANATDDLVCKFYSYDKYKEVISLAIEKRTR